MLLVDCVSG